MKNKIKDTILCMVILRVSFRYAFLLFLIYCQMKHSLVGEEKVFLQFIFPRLDQNHDRVILLGIILLSVPF